jgi:hypothetical protein
MSIDWSRSWSTKPEVLVWVQEGGERGSWHIALVAPSEDPDDKAESGTLKDGRAWRSARKDFT